MDAFTKIFGLAVISCTLLGTLSACNEYDSVDAPSSQEEEAPPAEVWVPPTDGTWPRNPGTGYGQAFYVDPMYVDTYEGVIQGLPSFTEVDEYRVLMTQEVIFTRVDVSVGGVVKVGNLDVQLFSGITNLGEGNPAGRFGEIECESEDIPNLGETTRCTLSAEVYKGDVPNSHWHIFRTSVASWPGQQ